MVKQFVVLSAPLRYLNGSIVKSLRWLAAGVIRVTIRVFIIIGWERDK